MDPDSKRTQQVAQFTAASLATGRAVLWEAPTPDTDIDAVCALDATQAHFLTGYLETRRP